MTRKIIVAAIAAAVTTLAMVGTTTAQTQHRNRAKPTIVLVHGAFADSSSWQEVTRRLHKSKFHVVAAANPLRGLASDADYVTSTIEAIDGPIILVGHSYGGAVITNAAHGNSNVKALVYIAGFAPETGESAAFLSGKFPGSTLGQTLEEIPLSDGQVDLRIRQDLFPQQFAADVPRRDAALMAIAQRPITVAALNEASGGRGDQAGVLDARSVLVVDEAGMVGSRKLERLLDHARRTGTKVVVVGDDRQLSSIDAGGGFRGLRVRLGASELTENRRQRHAWEREALELVRDGQVEQAVAAYREHDRMVPATSKTELTLNLVRDWWQTHQQAEASGQADRDAVILAYRRDEVDRLNTCCQQVMARNGRLGTEQLEVGDRTLHVGDRVVCGRNDLKGWGSPTAPAAPSPPWTPSGDR